MHKGRRTKDYRLDKSKYRKNLEFALYYALRSQWIFLPNLDQLIRLGILEQVDSRSIKFTATELGIKLSKQIIVDAIQVTIPNQPPLIFYSLQELIDSLKAGELAEGFLEDYLFSTLLFSVSIKKISLYDLGTLPEWEPI
jgi:hypothetical protein